MRYRWLFTFALGAFVFTAVGHAADRSRKEKDDKNTDIVNRAALAGIRRIAVVPLVAMEPPKPIIGFYSHARQEEERKRWEEARALAAEVAESVSELLPQTLSDWKRFEVAEGQVVDEAMQALKLKSSDLIQTKPGAKTITPHAEGVRTLKNALGVEALLLGGADVRWLQYDAEVNLHIQLIADDAAQPIVSTSVTGRSNRRSKAAAQAAMLIAMMLYAGRDEKALGKVHRIAVMVLPSVEALSDLSRGGIPSLIPEAKLDQALTRQLESLNYEVISPQQLVSTVIQMKLSPADLVSPESPETGSLPQVDISQFQTIAQTLKADGVLVAQILDVETTLSGTGWGVPPIIPYLGSIMSSPLFRHKRTYTVLRAQIIAPDKPYPVWTYVTQGMPPRKVLQNPKYLGELDRFFSDLSARMMWDMGGKMFPLPGFGSR